MITKLLLQEKVSDINVKLDVFKSEIETNLTLLTVFIEKVKAKINDYDLEIIDKGDIGKINDRLETYYDDSKADV